MIRLVIGRIIAWILVRLKAAADLEYINGSDALPPPLTQEEETKLLELLGKGEKSVRRILIERNLRLVVYIARKFENTGIGVEDLVSIGAIGLIKAVNTFDVDKNIKLATYASRCIENEILMYLRRNAKLKFEVSFDEPLNVDWDGNELLLSDILGTEPDVVYTEIEGGVEKDLMRDFIERLCERERMIMEMRFGLNGQKERTQKQVADYLGISQSYISRLEKRIIKQLRVEISKIV
jgi:RNA polymerase sporulation-specific sigma factor